MVGLTPMPKENDKKLSLYPKYENILYVHFYIDMAFTKFLGYVEYFHDKYCDEEHLHVPLIVSLEGKHFMVDKGFPLTPETLIYLIHKKVLSLEIDSFELILGNKKGFDNHKRFYMHSDFIFNDTYLASSPMGGEIVMTGIVKCKWCPECEHICNIVEEEKKYYCVNKNCNFEAEIK